MKTNIVKIILFVAILICVLGVVNAPIDAYILALFVISLAILLRKGLFKKKTKNAIQANSSEAEEFEEIYQEIQTYYKKPLEILRRKIIIKRIVMYITLAIFILACIVCQIGGNQNLTKEAYVAIPTVAMVSFGVVIFLVTKESKSEIEYVRLYKDEIIPLLVKLVEQGLNYKPKASTTDKILDRYVKPCFDVRTFNKAKVNDSIEGWIEGGLKARMAHIHLQDETYVGNKLKVTDLFRGLFVDVEGIRDIGTILKIFDEENEYCFAFGAPKYTKLEMDSLEFERKFNVYTPNKIVAMQLLTSDVMEKLLNLRKISGMSYEIVLQKKHMYIRVHTSDVFMPGILKSTVDREFLIKYYITMKLIVDLSKKMSETIKEANI